MWRTTIVYIYDCVDRVQVNASMRVQEDTPGAPIEPALQRNTYFESVGESDDAEWLRDALVALLEEL